MRKLRWFLILLLGVSAISALIAVGVEEGVLCLHPQQGVWTPGHNKWVADLLGPESERDEMRRNRLWEKDEWVQ